MRAAAIDGRYGGAPSNGREIEQSRMRTTMTTLQDVAERTRPEMRAMFADANLATKATLTIGYALSAPLLFVVARALRDPAGRTLGVPNRGIIVAELIGAGSVTTALFTLGQGKGNIVNALWVVACTTFWIRAENKLRLERVRQRETEPPTA
jgi:hypothetical protein